MRPLDPLSPAAGIAAVQRPALVRHVTLRRLSRVLSFTRLTIDDVVNDPIAKNQVRAYWKLSKQIDRQSETRELERQWNPLGLSS
jgi:hypothetical protein